MPGDPRSQDLLPPQPLPEHPQRFAQLLLQFGGLGLRSAVDAAPPTLHPGRIACRPFEHERRRQPFVLSAHYSPRRRPHRPPQQHVTRPLASASRATMFPLGTRCCKHGPHRKNASLVTFCEAGNIVLPWPATSARFASFLQRDRISSAAAVAGRATRCARLHSLAEAPSPLSCGYDGFVCCCQSHRARAPAGVALTRSATTGQHVRLPVCSHPEPFLSSGQSRGCARKLGRESPAMFAWQT